ncbi:TonB-dependent receptor plug [Desulfotignum phosphitoxidans DSM 13687]|uniref:TonB-dependent receptor plug n=2 Tax=Desulfotignum phosphitoxidans TaxID=190898 RepID=S0G7P5_9BACT|nr:TonB-dependent receptor plug [Desulfotignum phosphitoxidans DSM 13687]
MNMVKKILILACLFLAWTGSIRAEGENTKNTDITELEPLVVFGRKTNEVREMAIIGVKELQTPLSSGNLLDLLKNQAGLQVRRQSQSGTGSDALRIRGFNETRLSIRRDGIPLNRDGSYGNGPVDWGSLSAQSLESIEIFKGACPAKYGNTLGGVVNLVTRQPVTDPFTQVNFSMGSLSSLDTGFSHSWKKGIWGWSLSAGHYETDGYLRNNHMDRDRGSGKLSVDLPGNWEIGAGFDYSASENGNPVYNRTDSPYYDPSYPLADERELRGPGISARLLNGVLAWGDESYTEDENTSLTARIAHKTRTGNFRLEGRLWNQTATETYYDAADKNKIIYKRETDAEDNNWLLNTSYSRIMGDHLIELGGETRRYGWGNQRVSYIDESRFNGSINFMTFIKEGFKGQDDIMEYHAVYAQDTWQIRPDISLEFGIRQNWFKAGSVDPEAFGFSWSADVTSLNESHTDPRIGIVYSPTDTTEITARWGIAHRYPTSPEYFWWYLNNASSYFNTSFNPEKAVQYELGLDQTLGQSLELFIRGYYYDIEDYISSTTVPGVGSVYYNIGQVEIKGVEAGFSFSLPMNLRLWANATWQEGDKSDDPWDTKNALSKQLPDLPETMFNAGIDFDDKGPFSARIWVNHVDEREHLSGNSLMVLDAYTLVNMSGRYKIYKGPKLSAEIEATAENILDENYQEREGYPMAGTTVMAGMRFTF